MRHVNAHVQGCDALDFPSFWEGLSLRRCPGPGARRWAGFPFLLGRAFIEAPPAFTCTSRSCSFPFLLGRAFIEAQSPNRDALGALDFPSFWEGLSLRQRRDALSVLDPHDFPSFWEGLSLRRGRYPCLHRPWEPFPFLFGGAFIEAQRKLMSCTCLTVMSLYFFVGAFNKTNQYPLV